MITGVIAGVIYLIVAALSFLMLMFIERRADESDRIGVTTCTILSIYWPVSVLVICVFLPVIKLAELMGGIYSCIVERNDD